MNFLTWCVLYNTSVSDPYSATERMKEAKWSLHVGTGAQTQKAVVAYENAPVQSPMIITKDSSKFANNASVKSPITYSNTMVTLN